jgi:hypothetical protein
MSKGSNRRKPQVSIEEENLRWELIKSTTTPARKKEILKQLDKMKQQENIQ